MKNKTKKLFLQIEYLQLELEETSEHSTIFIKKFNNDFKKELEFLNSKQKPTPEIQKDQMVIVPPNLDEPSSPLIAKIYRNLAKKLHPDVSQLDDAEQQFKKIVSFYNCGDLIGLTAASLNHNIDLPSLSEEDLEFIQNEVIKLENHISEKKSTIAWFWCNEKENDKVLKDKVYYFLNISREEFEKWEMEAARKRL